MLDRERYRAPHGGGRREAAGFRLALRARRVALVFARRVALVPAVAFRHADSDRGAEAPGDEEACRGQSSARGSRPGRLQIAAAPDEPGVLDRLGQRAVRRHDPAGGVRAAEGGGPDPRRRRRPEDDGGPGRGPRPGARTRGGHVIEVDLSKDLLLIVNDGKVADILNTSTAGGYAYTTTGGGTAIATTPTGVFRIERTVDGMDVSPLGELWRPRYFYGGYAVHGDGSVPPYPASHGCVRISDAAIDWVWAANQAPIGTEVDIYG